MSRFGLGSISQKLFGSKSTVQELSSLHEIVNLQFGTAIALKVYPTGGDGEKYDVSYADLAGKVATVANAMESAGVGAGSIITLALPNSLEAVVCFAALQSLGGTALFVDPDASEESIASSAQSAGASVLISTESEVYARIAQAISLIHWTVESAAGAAEVVLHTQNGTISTAATGTKDPSEAAAIISSRSQGVPTLLPLSHAVISSAAKTFTATYNLDQTSCTLLAHPVHSVHGLLHLVSSLSSGGCLILTPGEAFVVSKLPELIQQDGMNYLCVPAVDVMKLCTYTREVGSDASALNFVRSCPGTIKTEVQTLEEVLKTSILEAYGPAQASGIATAVVKEDKAVGTQGKPVAGCQLRIFDDNKEVAPVDVEGDIAVAGEMVAPVGYIDQSTLNEAALYTDAEGVVWFLTGDRGQIDSEGNLRLAYDILSQTSVMSAAGAASFDLESRKMTEVAGASARAAIFASSFPQKESDAMRKELEGADLTTSALVTSALEGEDQAYTGLVSGDILRKRELVLESLKDDSRRKIAEKDAEDLRRANHELDLRASRMNSEREFMEEKEVGIRKKISQYVLKSLWSHVVEIL
uniref:AMP-dependent synthetase/ligase domain-containing protein n=1 Tax=Rhodosorus marinus TaxID=101924 RepID=A0A7S3EDF1_9RHOD|mmetsp:Transcript_23973/g.94399  ORF Transcript_23973/g.94399 Transcript_23973/m.94399 type:complete len:585 (+) Transcript_23973:109-1863(+)